MVKMMILTTMMMVVGIRIVKLKMQVITELMIKTGVDDDEDDEGDGGNDDEFCVSSLHLPRATGDGAHGSKGGEERARRRGRGLLWQTGPAVSASSSSAPSNSPTLPLLPSFLNILPPQLFLLLQLP